LNKEGHKKDNKTRKGFEKKEKKRIGGSKRERKNRGRNTERGSRGRTDAPRAGYLSNQ